MGKIERALVSVSDKNGLVSFARGLSALGIEIVSTGGTAALLSALRKRAADQGRVKLLDLGVSRNADGG